MIIVIERLYHANYNQVHPRLRLHGASPCFRTFTTTCIRSFSQYQQSFPTQQGGTLIIKGIPIEKLQLEIIPLWQEEVQVYFPTEEAQNSHFRLLHDTVTNSVTISPTQAARNTAQLKIHIPELFNIKIDACSLELSLQNKLMGDLIINCLDGNISLNRVKGENIEINGNQATIEVKKTIEGNANLNCQKLTAKMINVNLLKIYAFHHIALQALYSKEAHIHIEKGDLLIGLLRGHLISRIYEKGNFDIQGIDGTVHVSTQDGNIHTQINQLPAVSGNSSLVTDQGDVTCEVNHEVTCSISLGTKETGIIEINSEFFVGDTINKENHQKDGYKTISGELKPIRTGKHISTRNKLQSGNIDLLEAEIQSQLSSPSITGSDAKPPALRIQATERIRLGSLSWMDVIKRKHGFY